MNDVAVARLRALIASGSYAGALDLASARPSAAAGACAALAPPDAIAALGRLAPCGAAFRSAAAAALPQIVRHTAREAGRARAGRAGKAARADLAAVAALLGAWRREYGGEAVVRRLVGHVCAENEVVAEMMQGEVGEVGGEVGVVARVDAEEVEKEAGEVGGEVEALLGEIRSLFQLLGREGMAELGRGKADGVGESVREIWVRLRAAEERAGVVLEKAMTAERVEALVAGEDAMRGESWRVVRSLRAVLERVEGERQFCRAMKVKVPESRAPPRGGGVGSGVEGNESSDDEEEWEDTVFVKCVGGDDSSDDEDDRSGGVAEMSVRGNVLSLPPVAGIRRRRKATGARPAKKGDGRARERLKSKLGKKRTRKPVVP